MIRIFPRNKFRRRLAWFLTSLLLLGFIIHLGANFALSLWWRSQIQRFNQQTPGGYRVVSDDPRVNLFTGSVSLNNLHIHPAVEVPNTVGETGKGLPAQFDITLPSLRISGIGVLGYLLHKKLFIGEITLSAPTVHRLRRGIAYKDGIDPAAPAGYNLDLALDVRSVQVGKLILDSLRYVSERTESSGGVQSPLVISTRINDLKADFINIGEGRSRLAPDSLAALLTHTSLVLPGGMYEIALGELGFDVGRRELWAKRAEFLPRFRRGIFSRRLGRRTTRATLVVQEIKWRCENLFSALAEKKLVVEHFLASGVNLKMYRDKRLPRTGQRRIHRFPQSILRGLPLVVAVKEGRINRGTIEYLERDDMLTEPARLYFTDVAVLFRDLHNHPSLYPGPEETPCVVDVQARIMGKNLLSTRFILDMFDPNDSFRFEGGVSDMEGGILNPFLINASVRVAEGHVHSLRFSAAGNRFSASGTMRINYRDLKISILSKKKPGKRRGIPSFLANRVILSSNPKKNRPLRLGDMASLRRGRKPIFDLIWRSVLAGIKSSVGITKAKKR